MAGPSKSVQGGYLGYSALTDSYNKALGNIQARRAQGLKNEELELANEETINDQFTLPEAPVAGAGGGGGRGKGQTTVVTNGGFAFTANPNDATQLGMLTQDPTVPVDPYKQSVASQQRDIFKGKDITLDGSKTPQGGTFNATLQGALEGLKGEYLREGRRTSPRKRREGRKPCKTATGGATGVRRELQGAQQAYKQAYDNDLISFGTGSQYIDLLNTLQVPNDLQLDFKDGRGVLVGTSSAGMPINLPIDNLESIKNGLVLKGNNPQPLVAELIKEVNKVTQGVDAQGIKTESNAWTIDKTNMVENQLGNLLKSDQDVLSMGVDWLGYDPTKFKSMVQEAPQEARQNVLDALTYHVRSQHQLIDKGGLDKDKAIDNALAADKFDETKRHNRVSEDQAQQRIDKPTGGGSKKTVSPEEQLKQLKQLKTTIDGLKVPKGKEGWFGTSAPSDRVLSKLVGGNIKKARFSAGDKDSKDQFPDGYYEIEVAGGGTNRIDVTDKELLLKYIAGAQGIDPKLLSNEIKSGTSGKKTPAQLAAEYRARKQ